MPPLDQLITLGSDSPFTAWSINAMIIVSTLTAIEKSTKNDEGKGVFSRAMESGSKRMKKMDATDRVEEELDVVSRALARQNARTEDAYRNVFLWQEHAAYLRSEVVRLMMFLRENGLQAPPPRIMSFEEWRNENFPHHDTD